MIFFPSRVRLFVMITRAIPRPIYTDIIAYHVQEAHLKPGNATQIIGKVNPDLSIRVLSALDLGPHVGT